MEATFKPCVVIPSFNHWKAMPGIIKRMREFGLAVFVIDDGGADEAKAALSSLHDPNGEVRVSRLPTNRGKGAAVLCGFAQARAAGFTHCVQLDADGQHDLVAVGQMLTLARTYPNAVIAGQATYDNSAPLGRIVGRWITHLWVWIETLSFEIRDSMCGLRVYPLAAVRELTDRGDSIGKRMDFDTEILVRLKWAGTSIINHPVRVVYPPDNTSNFKMWRDNWTITRMHIRLVAGLLVRLLRTLSSKQRRLFHPTHWAGLAERGVYLGLRCSAMMYRLLGRAGVLAVLSPVTLYFYATAGERRRASLDFLGKAFAVGGVPRSPTWWDGYRHFFSFAQRAVDSFGAWIGRMPTGTVRAVNTQALDQALQSLRGAVFIVSHHGNVDISRALLTPEMRRRIVILAHTRHAENYNRVLREFNPEAGLNTFQVSELGPETAIELEQRIDRGQWLFIAGDRTPIFDNQRRSVVRFLGADAEFPQGPYLLAALLNCPVYVFFCRRQADGYSLEVEQLVDRIVLPRGKRNEALAEYVATYVAHLEKQVIADPFQWYNFYDFWRPSQSTEQP